LGTHWEHVTEWFANMLGTVTEQLENMLGTLTEHIENMLGTLTKICTIAWNFNLMSQNSMVFWGKIQILVIKIFVNQYISTHGSSS
jgi:hypothetical protein